MDFATALRQVYSGSKIRRTSTMEMDETVRLLTGSGPEFDAIVLRKEKPKGTLWTEPFFASSDDMLARDWELAR